VPLIMDLQGIKNRRGGGVKDQMITQGNQAIPYSQFWAGLLKSAESIDVEDNVMLQMSKKQMLEFIGKIYTEKILVDEVDDRCHMPRQSLSEFLYDYHLELLSEPLLAEEALMNIVANARLYEGVSARVKMFCRFLQINQEKPLPVEALSVFLLALVKIQNGEIPLLPDYDQVNVDATKAAKVIEFVFAQAPYVIRSKILLEAEKRVVGKVIDLDSLLYFLVDQYVHESSRGEERLRALFVASDMDGDGNLTLNEFQDMVMHINSRKSHRELLRMYAEMTLNRTVDCNTFVRVCRKFSFFSFTYGPHTKKVDRQSNEVFEVLAAEWEKVEDLIHELLVVLEGSAVGMRLEQNVKTLKSLLDSRFEAESAWHCYRKVVSEFASAIKNRTPGMGRAESSGAATPVEDSKEGGKEGKPPLKALGVKGKGGKPPANPQTRRGSGGRGK